MQLQLDLFRDEADIIFDACVEIVREQELEDWWALEARHLYRLEKEAQGMKLTVEQSELMRAWFLRGAHNLVGPSADEHTKAVIDAHKAGTALVSSGMDQVKLNGQFKVWLGEYTAPPASPYECAGGSCGF